MRTYDQNLLPVHDYQGTLGSWEQVDYLCFQKRSYIQLFLLSLFFAHFQIFTDITFAEVFYCVQEVDLNGM